MDDTEDKRGARLRKKVLRELRVKAKFLNYFALFAIIIFALLLLKLYPNREHSMALIVFASAMEAFAIGFFVLTRRIMAVLGGEPEDAEIAKWADFLSHYYYPKFIFRRKRNPFVIPDDED